MKLLCFIALISCFAGEFSLKIYSFWNNLCFSTALASAQRECIVKSCPQGQIFDKLKCACVVCPKFSCVAGYYFNQSQCKCARCTLTCPLNQYLNLFECKCYPCSSRFCPSSTKLTYLRGTCECLCYSTCPRGSYWDVATCRCKLSLIDEDFIDE